MAHPNETERQLLREFPGGVILLEIIDADGRHWGTSLGYSAASADKIREWLTGIILAEIEGQRFNIRVPVNHESFYGMEVADGEP